MGVWGARELLASQSLVVGAVLCLSGLAKLPGLSTYEIIGNTALARLVPRRLLLPIWSLVAALELTVGSLVLLLPSARWPNLSATLLLTGAAVYVVWALRAARDRPCGCFGAASFMPVSMRGAARALLLAAMAAGASVVATPWSQALRAPWLWALLAAELALLVWLSDERHGLLYRLTQRRQAAADPPPASLEEVLGGIHASQAWASLRPHLQDERPADQWRDGCHWFVTFRAVHDKRPATAVFAISPTAGWRSECSAALVDDHDELVLAAHRARP